MVEFNHINVEINLRVVGGKDILRPYIIAAYFLNYD